MMLLAALSVLFTLAFASVAMAQSAYTPADSTIDCSDVEEGTPGIEFFFVPDAGGCIAEGYEGGGTPNPVLYDFGKVVFDPDTGERLGTVRDLDPDLSSGTNSLTHQEFCESFDGLPERARTAQEYFEQGADAEEQAILDPDGDGLACTQELKYVALGDSFSSGEGVPPFILPWPPFIWPGPPFILPVPPFISPEDSKEIVCHRSTRAYAKLLDQDPELNFELQAFEACSGATTWEVVENQLGAITEDTDLVTITIGGNDVGFAWFVRQCLEPRGSPWDYLGDLFNKYLNINSGGESCEKGKTPYADITANISRLHNGLGDALGEIQDEIGPDTKVLVVGYPFVVEERLYTENANPLCLVPGFNVNQREQRAAVDVTLALNAAIGEAVARMRDSRFRSVSATGEESPFTGHDMCSGQPYFNGLDLLAPKVYLFGLFTAPKVTALILIADIKLKGLDLFGPEKYIAHPNKKGQAAYAKLIKDYWLAISKNQHNGGVCERIADCERVDRADVDGDGRPDDIALVGEPDEYPGGPDTQITVRVLLADGTTLTREADLQSWYGDTAWHGAADFGQVPGEELVIGGTSGPHTKWYRVLTYRDGELVELPRPDSDPDSNDTYYSTMWPIDAALSAYVGVQCDTADSTVMLRSVTSQGVTSEQGYDSEAVTYEGEATNWVLDGNQWRMTGSRKLEYPDGESASEIAGWQCGDLPRGYDLGEDGSSFHKSTAD